MEKKDIVQKTDSRRRTRPKRVGPTRSDSLTAWAHQSGASGTASPSVFRVPLHIYEKVDALGEEEFSRNKAPPPPRSSFSETD